jgi:hypothetical protein
MSPGRAKLLSADLLRLVDAMSLFRGPSQCISISAYSHMLPGCGIDWPVKRMWQVKPDRLVDELSGLIHSASGCDAAWQVWYIGAEPVSDFSKITAYRITIL